MKATIRHPLDEHAEFVRVLKAQTAGNPFFIRELLLHLIESGQRANAGMTAAGLENPGGVAARDR